MFAVEIDPVMLEVAEMYFDLQPDDNFHVIIDDGLSFIEKCKEDGKFEILKVIMEEGRRNNSIKYSHHSKMLASMLSFLMWIVRM